MAASPSYSDRPQFQGIQRSVTLPNIRPQTLHERAGLDKADANEEVFYTHPSVKIFEFAPSQASIRSNNKDDIPVDTDYPVDTIETLPWRSRTETLLASGRLTIEKVRGSTTFWKCQTVTRPIMRNSQTWCVDGQSKFVLRVGPFKYYRVELPSITDEDKQKVEDLKVFLPTVHKYESTPCPFVRSFTVILPEDAITPRRKGMWKRRDSSQNGLSDTETISPLSAHGGGRLSARHPPTSYPKKGPAFSSPVDNSSASPIGFSRNSSMLNEERTDSPTDNMFYEEDKASDDDASHDRNKLEELQTGDVIRGRSHAPRQVSAPVPVSVRIASIERAKNQYPTSPLSSQRSVSRGLGISQIIHKDNSPSKVIERSRETRNEQPGSNEANFEPEIEGEETQDNTEEIVKEPQILMDQQVNLQNEVDQVTEGGLDGVVDAPANSTHPGQQTTAETARDIVSDQGDTAVGHTLSEEHMHSATIPQNQQKGSEEALLQQEVVISLPGQEDVEALNEANTSISVDERNTETEQERMEPVLQVSDPFPGTNSNEDVGSGLDADKASRMLPSEVPDIAADVHEIVQITELDQRTFRATDKHRLGGEEEDDAVSVVSSTDSFHTMSSNIIRSTSDAEYDFDKTPVALRPESSVFPGLQHRRELSEMTVTASDASDEAMANDTRLLESAEDDNEAKNTDTPLANSITSDSSWPGTRTPIPQAVENGLRQRLRARRSFSPMPPASTMITANPTARQTNNHDMAKAVLQTIFFKPMEVAALLFHVITRIAAGAPAHELLSGELFRRPEHRRRVSGFADQHQLNGNTNHHDNDDYAQEDDYGVPIRGRSGISQRPQLVIHDFNKVPGTTRSREDDDYDADSFLSVD